MPASEPRAHHFVPEFYLGGFSDTGDRDGRLVAIGLGQQSGREWSGTPKELGHQRDFYRDDSSDDDPMWFEREVLGEGVDGPTSVLLQRIREHPQLPQRDSEDWNLLMSFIAIMYARGPAVREMVSRPLIHTARIIMEMVTQNRETYEHHVREAKAAGDVRQDLDVPYEQALEAVQNDGLNVTVGRPYLLRTIVETAESVLPTLHARRWILFINDQPHAFLVSDHPVSITFTDARLPSAYDRPAFGRRGTDVTFPVSKELALVGRFESADDSLEMAGRGVVPPVNSKTLEYARRFISGPAKESFVFARGVQEVGYGELLAALKT